MTICVTESTEKGNPAETSKASLKQKSLGSKLFLSLEVF